MNTFNRNSYNAITNPPSFVYDLLREAERAGSWETGIASDKKQRGSAINTSVYGFCTSRGLAVVQVRECVFHPRRFNRVRKDYYLIGRVESGDVFTHSIDSPCRSKFAMSDPVFCVDYVLAKIWGVKINELGDVVRQGDVAFIPVADIPADAIQADDIVIRDSHKIIGTAYKYGDDIFVKRGARMTHLKSEHAAIKARYGCYRVVAGYRAPTHGFSAPTAD